MQNMFVLCMCSLLSVYEIGRCLTSFGLAFISGAQPYQRYI